MYEQEKDKDFVVFLDRDGKYSAENEETLTTSGVAEIQDNSEEVTDSQGAINEETGEINWDCPCLKSALAPPCGDFFKEAFSCFVASKSEPKGMECLDKFTAMQDCFRAHPEVYMNGNNDDEDLHADDSALEIEKEHRTEIEGQFIETPETLL